MTKEQEGNLLKGLRITLRAEEEAMIGQEADRAEESKVNNTRSSLHRLLLQTGLPCVPSLISNSGLRWVLLGAMTAQSALPFASDMQRAPSTCIRLLAPAGL
eukprot:scaffold70533_cov18-Tisochrysis_lutea.AAC.5